MTPTTPLYGKVSIILSDWDAVADAEAFFAAQARAGHVFDAGTQIVAAPYTLHSPDERHPRRLDPIDTEAWDRFLDQVSDDCPELS